jgi:hypothetical protein
MACERIPSCIVFPSVRVLNVQNERKKLENMPVGKMMEENRKSLSTGNVGGECCGEGTPREMSISTGVGEKIICDWCRKGRLSICFYMYE